MIFPAPPEGDYQAARALDSRYDRDVNLSEEDSDSDRAPVESAEGAASMSDLGLDVSEDEEEEEHDGGRCVMWYNEYIYRFH